MCSNRCCKTWRDCLPNNFYTDFEITIPNAVRTLWPGCEVKSCRFHLGQNWWSKIQSLGLNKQYTRRKKEGLLVETVLEENIRTVAFIASLSQRLLAFDFVSSLQNDK